MTGQDGLRDEIAAVLLQHTRTRIEDCRCGWGVDAGNIGQSHTHHTADAVLDKVQARIDAAREQVAEQIAQAMDSYPEDIYPERVFGGPWTLLEASKANQLLKDAGLPTYDRVGATAMRRAYHQAARIARQHAKGDGDE